MPARSVACSAVLRYLTLGPFSQRTRSTHGLPALIHDLRLLRFDWPARCAVGLGLARHVRRVGRLRGGRKHHHDYHHRLDHRLDLGHGAAFAPPGNRQAHGDLGRHDRRRYPGLCCQHEPLAAVPFGRALWPGRRRGRRVPQQLRGPSLRSAPHELASLLLGDWRQREPRDHGLGPRRPLELARRLHRRWYCPGLHDGRVVLLAAVVEKGLCPRRGRCRRGFGRREGPR